MPSVARYTYPRVVWRGKQRYLWNPIHRKTLKNRPEERVRLRIIEYLTATGWSKHRISTEEPVGHLGDAVMRTDIICYSRKFEPLLLVECKAEHIPISMKTAEQAARYNQKVNAPFLLLTNGVTDFWYRIGRDSRRVKELEQKPGFLHGPPAEGIHEFVFWESRGFAGSGADPALRNWLTRALPRFWLPENDKAVRYLNFNAPPADLDISHYYHIRRVSENRRIALSTMNSRRGETLLIGILNEEDHNTAVLVVKLDSVFNGKASDSSLYSASGVTPLTLKNRFAWPDEPMEIFERLEDLFFEFRL